MLQFGASLTGDARVVIKDCNMFIIQATDVNKKMSFRGQAGFGKITSHRGKLTAPGCQLRKVNKMV